MYSPKEEMPWFVPRSLFVCAPPACTSPVWPVRWLVMGLVVATHCAALHMVPAAAWGEARGRGLAPASPAPRCLDLWLWAPQISLLVLGESEGTSISPELLDPCPWPHSHHHGLLSLGPASLSFRYDPFHGLHTHFPIFQY